MRLRRLGWAGVEIETSGYRVVVDLLLDPGFFAALLGEERDAFVAPEPGVDAALLTHLHRDHADVAALEAVLTPGAPIHRPRPVPLVGIDERAVGPVERELAELERPVVVAEVGATATLGPFEVTAVDAVDGLGSPQVSWVISDGTRTVLHAGDTLWHGRWWHVAQDHGPVDVALLPANGAVLDNPVFRPAVPVPAAMTPEQAVEAARALGAATLVPIHVNGTFSRHPAYVPEPDAGDRVVALGDERGQPVRLLTPGDWHDVDELVGSSRLV